MKGGYEGELKFNVAYRFPDEGLGNNIYLGGEVVYLKGIVV